ncbi:MAG: NAD(P)/FAD-dependent oxidoreductase [candidate division Zixibacteria bacterium]|nr:NAD(P)/FAD-dependent oxidoreductase [candidate division Zixibacteria bacterium]
MKNEYDVIIIGAGPAGLSAAEELRRHDRSVLVVEKNSTIGPKVCAGVLNARITELGFSLDLAEKKFSAIQVYVNNKGHTVSLPKVFLISIDREKFGRHQLDRVLKLGADITTGSHIKKITAQSVFIHELEIRYKYLIGADGSTSVTRKYLGLKTQKYGVTYQYRIPELYDEFRIYFDARNFGAGYGWFVPHTGYALIGTGRSIIEAGETNLKLQCQRWCGEKGIDLSSAHPESWPINYDYRGWQFGNIFLVGDAAGLTSGLTGEGIYSALVSGREAARKIIDPACSCPGIDNILLRKRHHERILSLIQSRRSLTGLYHHLMLFMTGNRHLSGKIIDFLF